MTDVIPVQSCYLGVVYRLDHPALVGAWSGETFLVVNVQGTVVPVAHTAARPMELVAIVPGGVPLVAGNER